MPFDVKDIMIILELVALVLVVALVLFRGSAIDKELADRLERMDSPESRERLHQAYSGANATVKQIVDIAAILVNIIAPMTQGKADDAGAKLLRDIQSPPPPPAPAPEVLPGQVE